MGIQIFQTSVFAKQIKKLNKKQRSLVDDAIKKIVDKPSIGEQKKGDLSTIWVYKFPIDKQQYLLAYQWDPEKRILIALGVHENFYRNIKHYLK